ncbi:glycosyltransferase family 1 protein [Acidocella sp.]|uniref:glycosyltransferase family 4 protein n=1 Tax=Acidocella sp. TaxID=50710 RepID=UPI00260859A3|nr:glycosyltransferase family 1 protein [Acidocella sp.]
MTCNRLWLDLSDVTRFFAAHARPTGIQRFSLETARALAASGGPVRFCATSPQGWRELDFAGLSAAIAALSAAPLPTPAARTTRAHTASPWPAPLIALARRLPWAPRLALGRLARAGLETAHAAGALGRVLIQPRHWHEAGLGGRTFHLGPARFAPGDWLVGLGASWESPPSPDERARLRALGVRLGFAVHDLIPLLRPEYCLPAQGRALAAWLDGAAREADMLFAVSRHTAADARARLGAAAPPMTVLPMGGGPLAAPPDARRVPKEPFVLMVATFEARKNHAGALRLWRLLLSQGGAVPKLVLAGRRGWLADDVLAQIAASEGLGGRVEVIEQPSDAELRALYQACLFSLFPSFYEGWGLPVSEALAHGVPVLASSASAIPEAGGAFCAYFDPDHLAEAARLARLWLDQPDELAALKARIRAQYRPLSWQFTARALVAALNAPAPEPGLAGAADHEARPDQLHQQHQPEQASPPRR